MNDVTLDDAPVSVRVEFDLLQRVLYDVADLTGQWSEPLTRPPIGWLEHAPGQSSFVYPNGSFLIDVSRGLVLEHRAGITFVYGADGRTRMGVHDDGLRAMREVVRGERPPRPDLN